MANGLLDQDPAMSPAATPGTPTPAPVQPAGVTGAPAGMPPQGAGMPPQGAGMPPQGAGMPPQGAGMPPQGAGMPPGQGVPQAERDYAANPLNEDDMDKVDEFRIMATRVVHSPETREKIVARIKGVKHPYDEVADASLVVINRVEKERQWDQAVKLLGSIDAIGQVIEIAQAAGKIPEDIPETDRKIIVGQSIQKYYQQKLASGEISKEQAAKDAHLIAMAGAGDQGIELQSRITATQGVNKLGKNPLQKVKQGQLKAPQPAADPQNPETTMKEALANREGGLLDG